MKFSSIYIIDLSNSTTTKMPNKRIYSKNFFVYEDIFPSFDRFKIFHINKMCLVLKKCSHIALVIAQQIAISRVSIISSMWNWKKITQIYVTEKSYGIVIRVRRVQFSPFFTTITFNYRTILKYIILRLLLFNNLFFFLYYYR